MRYSIGEKVVLKRKSVLEEMGKIVGHEPDPVIVEITSVDLSDEDVYYHTKSWVISNDMIDHDKTVQLKYPTSRHYRVGEYVLLREDLVIGERYGAIKYNKSVESFVGRALRIKSVLTTGGTGYYYSTEPRVVISNDMINHARSLKLQRDLLKVRELENRRRKSIKGENYMKKDLEDLNELLIQAKEFNKRVGRGNSFSEALKNLEDLLNEVELYTIRFQQKEVPEIPEYVGITLEYLKGRIEETGVVPQVVAPEELPEGLSADKYEESQEWVKNNFGTYAKAYTLGYTVKEEEKKYVVRNKDGSVILFKTAGVVCEVYNSMYLAFDEKHLTEKEIKDYDERFWAFAEPVGEERELW